MAKSRECSPVHASGRDVRLRGPLMRICLVYDCLYPHTVGGAERVYRQLALRLRDAGHEVTYLTMRQWDGELDDLEGIDVRAVAPRMELYDGERRRRTIPPIV